MGEEYVPPPSPFVSPLVDRALTIGAIIALLIWAASSISKAYYDLPRSPPHEALEVSGGGR